MGADAGHSIARGQAALLAYDWVTAQRHFEAALEADDQSPEAVDGLGQALYWQHRYAEALKLRQRAYAGFREQGDRRRAAFVAVQLAQLHGLIHGNAAAVNGWLGHARRMLEDSGDCAEQGWLELFLGGIAADPAEREERTRRATDVGRRFGSTALEYDALGYLGKAKVEQGEVAEGMALIDEAVAATTSGVVTDPWAAGEIYCTLFHACEMTVDVRRAEDWMGTVDRYVDRTGELPISAICRMHYGGLLTSAGRFDDADRELTAALTIYDDTYTGSRTEPLFRLADLRARQGRFDECARLLEGHEDRRAAALPRARMLAAGGDLDGAAELLARLVRPESVSAPRSLTLVPAMALLVEVEVARGRSEVARVLVDDLERIATATRLASFRGIARRAAADLAARETAGADRVRELLEEAAECFGDAGLVSDAAQVRGKLADLHELSSAASDGSLLTPRQREVLALVADGLSNAEIAEHLYISPRTAEHHVSNILAALQVKSRTEAAALAHRGLTSAPRR